MKTRSNIWSTIHANKYWSTKILGYKGGFLAERNDWELRAVLRYKAQDYEALKKQSIALNFHGINEQDKQFYHHVAKQYKLASTALKIPTNSKREAKIFYQSPLMHGEAIFIAHENIVFLSLLTL